MKTIKKDNAIIELYEDIDELPMVRFHKFNKYLFIDSCIGSDLSALDMRIERVIRYISDDNKKDAELEMRNLRQTVFLIQNEIAPKHYAFAVMVKSINGVECSDISDAGIKSTFEKIGKIFTNKEAIEHTENIKKKIDLDLLNYFPSIFDSAATKEYYDLLLKRTKALLKGVIDQNVKGSRDEVDKFTGLLLTYSRPHSFDGSGSAEIEFDRNFENLCLMLGKQLNVNAKTFTVLEYYNSLVYLRDENKRNARTPKKKP